MESAEVCPSKARRILPWILGAAVLGIAALLVLGLMESQRRSNEQAASAALKAIASAQADFRGNDRDGNRVQDFRTADVAGLYTVEADGQPIKLIDPAIAAADAVPLKPLLPKPVSYHGYYFIVLDRDENDESYRQRTDSTGRQLYNTSKFGVCAYPAKYGRTSRMSFLINEGNTVYKSDRQGLPIEVYPPLDPNVAVDWAK